MSEEYTTGEKEALLLSNLNNVEAEIIISKLKSYGIPVLRKEKGTGAIMEIYTGVNLFGIDLYVPSHALVVAKKLLDSNFIGEQIDDI
ncbi:MAG: hypothetical protein ACERLG_11825 [Sedimentibacter sp.]